MFKIQLIGSGMFSFIAQNEVVRAEIIADIVGQAQAQAFLEWCQRSGDVSLAVRFEPRGFALKGFSARSKSYQAKQLKWMGEVTPYTSPRRPNLIGVAKALTSPHPQARRILQSLAALKPHASTLMKSRGTGFNVQTTGLKRVVRTKLTLPGMVILNRIQGIYGERYRQEFLAFNRGGRRDGMWIRARASELAIERLLAYIGNQRRRLLGDTP